METDHFREGCDLFNDSFEEGNVHDLLGSDHFRAKGALKIANVANLYIYLMEFFLGNFQENLAVTLSYFLRGG